MSKVYKKCVCGCPGAKPTFKFPDNRPETLEKRKQWLRLLDVNDLSSDDDSDKTLYACYRHFSMKMCSGKRLYRHAVPDCNIKAVSERTADIDARIKVNLKTSKIILPTLSNSTRPPFQPLTPAIPSALPTVEATSLPVENSAPVQKPFEDSAPIPTPVEKTPPKEILAENSSPMQIPVECKTPIQTPVEATTPIQMSVESTPPIQISVNNSPSIQIPVENSPPIKMVVENVPPIKLPDKNTIPIQLPVGISPPLERLLCHEKMPVEYDVTKMMAVVGRQVQTDAYLSAMTPRKLKLYSDIRNLREKLLILEKELITKEEELKLKENELKIQDTELKIKEEELKLKDIELQIKDNDIMKLKVENETLLAIANQT